MPEAYLTAADLPPLLKKLGGVPPSRVLLTPTPGKATEKHLLAHHRRTGRICELVDGTLVEKTVATPNPASRSSWRARSETTRKTTTLATSPASMARCA